MSVHSIFATKIGMTQAWDTAGKRWAVTKCKIEPNQVIGKQDQMVLIGYGPKKLKNVNKPLRSLIAKGGFTMGVKQVRGVKALTDVLPEAGTTILVGDVLHVGDVVKVQGTSKGRGFAGAMKRHGFHGGPKTHGQSDRARAVGSIGAGTTPGKVLKGKRMPGHYGVETTTVSGLVVLHIDAAANEVWLSGPVPGSIFSTIQVSPTGKTREVSLAMPTAATEEVEVVAEETPVEEVVAEALVVEEVTETEPVA